MRSQYSNDSLFDCRGGYGVGSWDEFSDFGGGSLLPQDSFMRHGDDDLDFYPMSSPQPSFGDDTTSTWGNDWQGAGLGLEPHLTNDFNEHSQHFYQQQMQQPQPHDPLYAQDYLPMDPETYPLAPPLPMDLPMDIDFPDMNGHPLPPGLDMSSMPLLPPPPPPQPSSSIQMDSAMLPSLNLPEINSDDLTRVFEKAFPGSATSSRSAPSTLEEEQKYRGGSVVGNYWNAVNKRHSKFFDPNSMRKRNRLLGLCGVDDDEEKEEDETPPKRGRGRRRGRKKIRQVLQMDPDDDRKTSRSRSRSRSRTRARARAQGPAIDSSSPTRGTVIVAPVPVPPVIPLLVPPVPSQKKKALIDYLKNPIRRKGPRSTSVMTRSPSQSSVAVASPVLLPAAYLQPPQQVDGTKLKTPERKPERSKSRDPEMDSMSPSRLVPLDKPQRVVTKGFVGFKTHTLMSDDGHRDNNRGKFVCHAEVRGKLCGRVFKQKCHWRRHCAEVHAAKRPKFACPMDGCDKTYVQKASLEHHISYVHHGKTFDCEHCGKSFARKRSRDIHVETAHG